MRQFAFGACIRISLRLLRTFALISAVVFLGAASAYTAWCWRVSWGDAPLVTPAARELAWSRALHWVRQNEAALLDDPNSALWWMLGQTAAVSSDTYLASLVKRHVDSQYPSLGDGYSPWRRMIDGVSPITSQGFPLELLGQLAPYQRDFVHAATCSPVTQPDFSVTGGFLQTSRCTPNLWHAFTQDQVCATHQLMALQVYRQNRCSGPQPEGRLQRELTRDVQSQMNWMPWFCDAYIQRTLVLVWQQGRGAVPPVWVNRVVNAQSKDGGWSGSRRLFEQSEGLFVRVLERMLPPWLFTAGRARVSDFHATAQAMLLLSLSRQDARAGVWVLNDE